MWFDMREVDLDFIETAGKTFIATSELSAPRSQVWDAFVDPTTWHRWWPGVESAAYPEQSEPYGVGTTRVARVSGQSYEESIVAWEEGTRWAYHISRATVPIATAQLECTDFADCNGGTRVRWTLALDRRLLMWVATPAFSRYMPHLFDRAMRNLDAYLAPTGSRQ